MALDFDGFYVYMIQGFMHAQSTDDQHYDLNNKEIVVNRGGAELGTDEQNPDPGKTRPALELPIFTAFYSLNYPSSQFSNPIPPATPHVPPPAPPSPSGFFPAGNAPTYTPNTGYYPFSETGFMIFFSGETLSDTGTVISDGFVRGRSRVNTAGFGGRGRGADFQGSYKFDRFSFGIRGSRFATLPSGIITIQFDNLLSVVWDYTFMQVSQNELLLSASGRVPRPGVGTGTMRKSEQQLHNF